MLLLLLHLQLLRQPLLLQLQPQVLLLVHVVMLLHRRTAAAAAAFVVVVAAAVVCSATWTDARGVLGARGPTAALGVSGGPNRGSHVVGARGGQRGDSGEDLRGPFEYLQKHSTRCVEVQVYVHLNDSSAVHACWSCYTAEVQ